MKRRTFLSKISFCIIINEISFGAITFECGVHGCANELLVHSKARERMWIRILSTIYHFAKFVMQLYCRRH